MVPFFTLERQNKILEKELNKTVKEVIDKGNFILGKKVIEFEESFAEYVGVKYAVGVASGTDAISLALLSVGIKSGDEVVMPANAYPTAFAVTAIGAIPQLVDIDPLTFNIDPLQITAKVGKRTKAIIAVHLYGQPADMQAIGKIGGKFNIPVIEDCAQAHGAEINIAPKFSSLPVKFPCSAVRSLVQPSLQSSNPDSLLSNDISFETHITARSKSDLRKFHLAAQKTSYTNWQKVGSIGDIGCFSFYPTKNLGCFGDGGMVVTNNEEIYKRIKLLRTYGEERRYHSVLLGRNSRLDELQAAILLVKLKYLDTWNKRRREIANIYNFQFSIFNFQMELPFEAPSAKHIYHLFVFRTKKRDQLKKYLEEKGIQTAIHYPTPIHLQPSFKYLGHKKGDFPESEKACEEVLSLPCFPELENKEIETVVKEIANGRRNEPLGHVRLT